MASRTHIGVTPVLCDDGRDDSGQIVVVGVDIRWLVSPDASDDMPATF